MCGGTLCSSCLLTSSKHSFQLGKIRYCSYDKKCTKLKIYQGAIHKRIHQSKEGGGIVKKYTFEYKDKEVVTIC